MYRTKSRFDHPTRESIEDERASVWREVRLLIVIGALSFMLGFVLQPYLT